MTARQLYDAGYKSLVSVIPPKAPLAPTTGVSLEARGKVPGRRRLDGRWVGYPFTKEDDPAPRDIIEWERWGSNVGLRADYFPGLDVDVDEPWLAERVVEEAQEFFGPAPVRTSQDPRRLLVYQTEEPFTRISCDIAHAYGEDAVEMLGKGRQYLVHGDHPSGNKYGWGGEPLWERAPEELTAVTVEQVREFFSHLADILHPRANVQIQGTGETKDTTAPPQESLEAPSLEELEELVARIPNRFPDRDRYIQTGCAIKAAGGEEAYPIFLDWAERWEDGDNPEETVEADWSRMHPPFRVGWEYLQDLAREYGDYEPAQEEFGADMEVPDFMPEPDPGEEEGGSTLAHATALTDTWVVEQVARRLAERARYVPESSRWHVWTDRR